MDDLTSRRSGTTRRELLGVLGLGAGAGLVATFAERIGMAAAQQGPFTSTQKLNFPARAIVRTILKDVPPDALASGAMLFHEHVLMNYTTPPAPPAPRGQDEAAGTAAAASAKATNDLIVDELRAAARDGMACIVEAAYRGRRPDAEVQTLKEIATRSGVHIILAGGYFHVPYPPGVSEKSEDQLAEEIVQDANAQRWGAFGEIGTSIEGIHTEERKVLIAVCKAHARTGIPIFSHNDHAGCPKCAMDQMDLFESQGVNPRALCIGHLSDITQAQDPGWSTHKALARRGVFLGFDTVGRALAMANGVDVPEAEKVRMVLQLLEAGYEDHVLLASDFASARDLKANWGNGFATALVQFVPKLRHAGVNDATIRKIVVDNPRRFLAFVPKV